MTSLIMKNCKVIVGISDMSLKLNNVVLNNNAELLDATTFGVTLTRQRVKGLLAVDATISGYQNSGDSVPEFPMVAQATPMPVSIGIDGADLETRVFMFEGFVSNWNPGGAVGALAALSMNVGGTQPLGTGKWLAATATFNTVAPLTRTVQMPVIDLTRNPQVVWTVQAVTVASAFTFTIALEQAVATGGPWFPISNTGSISNTNYATSFFGTTDLLISDRWFRLNVTARSGAFPVTIFSSIGIYYGS